MIQNQVNPSSKNSRQHGFSLIEIAIALAALGLIALLMTQYWATASRARSDGAQHDLSRRAQLALLSFAYVHSRLPCPAPDLSGVEASNCSTATTAEVGYLPWRTLGLPNAAAGGMRYGVYRNGALNIDFAVNTDRFAPLVPDPTISQTTTPVSLNRLIGNPNNIDLCSVLAKAALLPKPLADSDHLQTINLGSAERRNVAFALAQPGNGDADGDGNAFDGIHAGAAAIFEQPSRQQSSNYDDKVIAMSPQALFAALSCGQGLAAAGHSHFNVLNTAQIMAKSMDDYRFQLILNASLAAANALSSVATIASAGAAVANTTAITALGAAQAILTFGALSPVLIPGALAVAAALLALGAAIATTVAAVAASVAAALLADDFAPVLAKSIDLARRVRLNAFAGDAAGF